MIEGVETESQMEFLESLEKQPIVQGYFFGKPMKAEELEEWIGKKVIENY